MYKFLTYLCLVFISPSNSFVLSPYKTITTNIITKSNSKNNILPQSKTTILDYKMDNGFISTNHLDTLSSLLNREQSEQIVKIYSSLLPTFDGIAHYVLNFNDFLVNMILNNDHLSIEKKKELILFIINSTQKGDSMGSQILQLYYDVTNHLL
jgi:hypothetical protein